MNFLVIEPQALVCMDLSQALREVCPQGKIASVASLQQAHALCDTGERFTGVVVGVDVEAFGQSGLPQRLATSGAWIVCLNGRHTDHIRAQGWHPLVRPFSFEDVQRLVQPLLHQPGSSAAS